MDAAEAMNHIACAVEEAMGELVSSEIGAPWLPLSVRYAAAEAAAKVVIDWQNRSVGAEPVFCGICGRRIRPSQSSPTGWTHGGGDDWQGKRCPGRLTGAVPDNARSGGN